MDSGSPVRLRREVYQRDHPLGYDHFTNGITESLKPTWNGENSTWELFIDDWDYYMSMKSKQIGDDDPMK